jgi:hypothetical protein
MKKVSIIFLLTFGIILILSSALKDDEKITQQEAIKLAEEFIAFNGYTSAPADKQRINYELLDEANIEKLLKNRHNTLQPKAFYINEREDKWDIGFLSTSVNIKKLDSIQLQSNLQGRGVIVRKDGKEIRMGHKDPLFSKWKKLN